MCAARVGGKVAALRTVGEAMRASGDPRGPGFRVLVTKADGSMTVKTLGQLGNTEINLKADTTHVDLPDGSVIDGQAGFVMGGVTRTVANGGVVTNFWDMNGDGVFERVQRIVAVVGAGTRARTETVEDWHGATIAGGVKDERMVTVTSADGKQVTISRDRDWGGWFHEREVQEKLANGMQTVLIETLAANGSTISTKHTSIASDDGTRTLYANIDGRNALKGCQTKCR